MRKLLTLLFALNLTAAAAAQPRDDDSALSALRDGGIVVFRHAIAPGGGDPPGFSLGDCSTQRNLDATGREQARRIGERLRRERVMVGAVWTSQWCRTRETAELMGLAPVREMPAFNSFFGNRSAEPAQTVAARDLLLGWRGPGALVVSTHQVNINALTGVSPASGEGVVLRREGAGLVLVGRLQP
jgi:Histidine phosphatase superfamily (branch 1)